MRNLAGKNSRARLRSLFLTGVVAAAIGGLCGCTSSPDSGFMPSNSYPWAEPRHAFVPSATEPTVSGPSSTSITQEQRQACIRREVEKKTHQQWIGSISRQNTAAIEQDDRRCRDVLGPGSVATIEAY
jgi:hypothetical protein